MSIVKRLREITEGPATQNPQHTDMLNLLSGAADLIKLLKTSVMEAFHEGLDTDQPKNTTDDVLWDQSYAKDNLDQDCRPQKESEADRDDESEDHTPYVPNDAWLGGHW